MSNINIINPNAAGIDIGSEFHYVCVPSGASEPRVRRFACFTNELNRLADWLKSCGVTTIAMESTGVYWIPPYEVLTSCGFEVILANAKYVKNVPGRKTDVQDAQWLQQLHSYGLLHGSFRPADHICVLRGYMRQRDSLVKSAGSHIQRMQKALTQMNIQLHKVISDITGATGLNIIQSILSGERDPIKLAKLRNSRIQKGEAEIAEALVGNYREEHLFSLQQEHDLYMYLQEKIAQCDQRVLDYYAKIETRDNSNAANGSEPAPKIRQRKSKKQNSLIMKLHAEQERISGIDFTKVPGLDVLSTQIIISEVGLDSSKWPNEKNFVSWLGLSPANKITGGKVFSTRTRKVNNRAAVIFRTSAVTVGKSKSSLGAFYRRLKSRVGAPKAITATARKLACLFYNMLKHGSNYVEKGMDEYEKRYHERVIKNLERKAQENGYSLIKTQVAPMTC